jgi:hypothetical protein
MPKSNRLAEGETKLCTSTSNWSKTLDSGLRRNDEQKHRRVETLQRARVSAAIAAR